MPDSDTPSDGNVWTLDLDDAALPPIVAVRRWCGRALAQIGEPHLNDVLLAAVELLANAYDHGGGARQVRLSHSRQPCWVRIEVEDNSRERPRMARHGRADQVRGRGLIILDRLAGEWGVRDEPAGEGKSVWAVISCSGAERVPCQSPEPHKTDEDRRS
ncbi:ATP-binding protein [Kutzneria sp. NPDC051319]|uniref:ATP-binding protein n=1 Tax=Kutzneria sp. NPDC051319 TaxID=3155047 RepID=UPI00341698B8